MIGSLRCATVFVARVETSTRADTPRSSNRQVDRGPRGCARAEIGAPQEQAVGTPGSTAEVRLSFHLQV